MEEFKGKVFTSASRWLDIKFSSLILPFKKNLAIESDTWVRHLNTLLARGGGGGGGEGRREYFSKTIFKCERGDKVAWGYAELIDRLMK